MKEQGWAYLHEPFGVVGIISPWNYPFFDSGNRSSGGSGRGKLGRAQAF